MQKKIRKLKKTPYLTKNSAELEYFLGYTGSNGYLLILDNEEFYFFTDGRYYESYKNHFPDRVLLLTGGESVFESILKQFQNFKHEKLYINPDFFTYQEVLELRKTFKGISVKRDQNDVFSIRKIKHKPEIQAVEEAIAITEEGLAYIMAWLKEGVSEKETAVELEYYLKQKGADELSFPVIALFGENSALPHGEPGTRKLKAGDVVLIDVGVKKNHYCSDMTRTFAFKKADDDFRAHYELLLKLQKEAIESIKPGIKAAEIDKNLRESLNKEGLEKYYVHSLGHEVGVEVHEPPALSHLRPKEALNKGMLFTIEPGIYIPGKYGIRIEDMVTIAPWGKTRVLTSFPKELLVKH